MNSTGAGVPPRRGCGCENKVGMLILRPRRYLGSYARPLSLTIVPFSDFAFCNPAHHSYQHGESERFSTSNFVFPEDPRRTESAL